MRWLSKRDMSSDIALKAAAISAVVFNHAHQSDHSIFTAG